MTEAKTTEPEVSVRPATEDQPPATPLPTALTSESLGGGPNVEQGLYAILFVLALALRLYSLGDLNPISPWEAAQIWPAWLGHAAGVLEEGGFPEPDPPASPLLNTFQRALFLVTGGGSDFWARFAPACAGAGLVLAAWALRRRMGRGGALMAAVLFTFDPWLLYFSRLADGAALSALTCVLLLAALFDDSTEGRQVMWLAVVGGLFLISGPLAWLLLPLILYAIFLLRGGPLALLAPSQRRRAAYICVGTVVVGSTGLFAQISGLAAIGESVGVAITHLTGSPGGGALVSTDHEYTVTWALLRLLVDEPFLLLFGGAGLVVALVKTRFFTWNSVTQAGNEKDIVEAEKEVQVNTLWLNVMVVGAAWGLLLLLMPGRTPFSLLVVGLPLLLLAAGTATEILRFAPTRMLLQNDARMPALVTMGVLLVTAFFWTGNVTAALRDGGYDPRLTIFYLLIPALGAFFVWWSGVRASSQVYGLLALAAFFLAQASSSWMLNLRPEIGHSRALFAEIGDKGMELLVEDIARLSSLRTGDSTEALVYLHIDSSHLPFFGWHLRDMRNLQWQPGLDLANVEENALVVTQASAWGEGERAQLPASFIGSSYTATQRWLPTELENLGARLRWMFFREKQQSPGGAPAGQEAELWVIREK